MKKVKEIRELAKLYKINVPVEEHFEYYIKTLIKSKEFSHFETLANEFSDYEKFVEGTKYKSPQEYKMGFAFKTLKNFLMETNAYKKVMDFDISNLRLTTKDLMKVNEGKKLLSLDISSANFQSMKYFDKNNEMKSSWTELCMGFNIHPIIYLSKSFRQIVFGNLNPKRFQRIQHYQIQKIYDVLSEKLGEDNVVFVSHDEIVININDGIRKEEVCEIVDEMKINSEEYWMNMYSTVFRMEKIGKGIYVKDVFDSNDEEELDYKTLHGCPGNRFYINFKKHVLQEEVDERDLLFISDGHVAKWMI